MKISDLLKNVRYTIVQGEDIDVATIVSDSRKVSKGDVFVCIEGFQSDGHCFISEAFAAGAVAVVIEKDLCNFPKGATVIKVNNSRSAFARMAGNLYGNPWEKFGLIGFTGTNGKTSGTYFLESVLQECGYCTGIIGTIDTRVGGEHIDIEFATSTTPDPMELQQIFTEMVKKNASHVIMEVTSHSLALHKLDGHEFLVSVFTNLTQDHLDLHGTMNEYKIVKGKLFNMSKYSVVNIDDKYGNYMLEQAAGEFLTYSVNKPSNLQAKNINYSIDGISFDLNISGDMYHFTVPIPGKFTVYNALGVIGAALCMKIPISTIQSGLAKIKGVPGRIQRVPNDRGIGVFVDYSHTPDSLENIITSVREFTKNRIITVFGCGGDRDRTKRPIMGEIAGKLSDFSIITSDNPRKEQPERILDDIEPGVAQSGGEYIKIVDRKEAIYYAVNMAAEGDSVIIAGKGHENYQIFAEETVHFDDWEIAGEALKRR